MMTAMLEQSARAAESRNALREIARLERENGLYRQQIDMQGIANNLSTFYSRYYGSN